MLINDLKHVYEKNRNEGVIFLTCTKSVRVEGLEPPSLAAPDPKSGVSTNFTTPALNKNLLF